MTTVCIFFTRLKVKRRQKLIYGSISKYLGETFHDLAKHEGIVIEEGHLTLAYGMTCLKCRSHRVILRFHVLFGIMFVQGEVALLECGLAFDAEQVYRQNLKNYPKNGWAMYGLMQSLGMQNNDASKLRKALELAWQSADISLTASRF